MKCVLGIIALALDKGYDISIILTKGTKVLTKQTYQRLDKVFEKFIENDHVGLYDIMNTPEELTPYISIPFFSFSKLISLTMYSLSIILSIIG